MYARFFASGTLPSPFWRVREERRRRGNEEEGKRMRSDEGREGGKDESHQIINKLTLHFISGWLRGKCGACGLSTRNEMKRKKERGGKERRGREGEDSESNF